jgi:uncharacterized protein with HEPN domain
MIEAAEAIATYVQDVDRRAFLDHPMLQDAVLRRLTVIGEGANKVTETIQAGAPAVPWQRIIGFRNFVVHEYQRVDWAVVWDVVTRDLPAFTAHVQVLMTTLAGELGNQ